MRNPVGNSVLVHALGIGIVITAAMSTAPAMAQSQDEDSMRWTGLLAQKSEETWRVDDRRKQLGAGSASLTRRVLDPNGTTRYSSSITESAGAVDWSVGRGHPSQLVRVRITPGLVVARGADDVEGWRATPDAPLCLPEIMAELAVQMDAAARAPGGLRCLIPIDKARKLAPLRIRRLADLPNGVRRYEVGPGSLGMRLFFGRQEIEVAADGRSMMASRGQFEVARNLDGRLRYVEGDLAYAMPRRLYKLSPVLLQSPANR